jgi:predicted phage terminase large subunit-like protein
MARTSPASGSPGTPALKEKTDSDFAVGQVWGQFGADRYLLRQVRDRMALTETIQQVRELTAWVAERFPQFGSHAIFIEKAANGPEVIAAAAPRDRRADPGHRDRDKVSRAYAITPQLEAGNVLRPRLADDDANGRARPVRTPAWVQELIERVRELPERRERRPGRRADAGAGPAPAAAPGRVAAEDERWGKGKTITGA